MNPVLAQLYGTGLSKTASEDIDLTQISGADLLAGIDAGEIELQGGPADNNNDDTGDDEPDFSGMSGTDLVNALEELDAQEGVEKLAASGDIEYWDAAGRVMAHAYADETTKIASETNIPDEIDLDEISAEDALALIESGEFEVAEEEPAAPADGAEKVAGRLRAVAGAAGKWAKKPYTSYGRSMKAQARQAAAGHPKARGAAGQRGKAARTALTKNPRQAAAAAAMLGAAPAGLAGKKVLRRKKGKK